MAVPSKEENMKLKGLHLLLTYACTLECDHCFVWGSPWQSGTMTLRTVREILDQARDLGTVNRIYFEGGEPFLYYAILVKGVQEAAQMGFEAGIVSNGYWATDEQDAAEWLRPFAGLIQDLSVSSDLYHWSEKISQQARNASAAAKKLGIPLGYLSIAQPETADAAAAVGQLPEGESAVMYRGRAVETLVPRAAKQPWERFTACPYEDLREPGRVHVDPLGNVHICQGISLGNLFQTPLREICETYDPDEHPITGPLLAGGPVELVRRYDMPHEGAYADACHLCYETCRSLRGQFPGILVPDQMYGIVEG
jgi:MoaA/NifB/PqqE/SkfB family radical SAM enzyme